MNGFNISLEKAIKIESLFKLHPKYPFLNWDTNREEYILASLFLLLMCAPYLKYKDSNWCPLYGYKGYFSEKDSMCLLESFNLNNKQYFDCSLDTQQTNVYHSTHIQVNVYIEDILSASERGSDLFALLLGIDLCHPLALDKAREFMHAFFIDKLPLEKMQQKIDDFEQFEAHLFKRKQ